MPTIDVKHYGLLLAYAVLTALINLVFSKRSQIDEWCEANPKLAFVAKLCRGFGIDPWTIAQSFVLLFTSKLPGYQKQSLAELNKPKPPSGMGPMSGALMICLTVVAAAGAGCSWFTHSVEPIAKECAPSPSSLVAQVSQILLSGGDYETAIEQLALTDGADVVECAVKAAIDALMAQTGKVGANPDDGAAVARGNAYLAAHPVVK